MSSAAVRHRNQAKSCFMEEEHRPHEFQKITMREGPDKRLAEGLAKGPAEGPAKGLAEGLAKGPARGLAKMNT